MFVIEVFCVESVKMGSKHDKDLISMLTVGHSIIHQSSWNDPLILSPTCGSDQTKIQ